jgi:hydrogenase maturation protease
MTETLQIGVLAAGDERMGGASIASCVLNTLEARWQFPDNVDLRDLGDPGSAIASFLAQYDAIILIAPVHANSCPGDVRLYRKEQLVHVPVQPRVSPYAPTLVQSLLSARLSGKCPQNFLLVGIVPENCDLARGSSEFLKRSIAPAMQAVLVELHRLGVQPEFRTMPDRPIIWWLENVCSKVGASEHQHVPGDSR